VKILLLQDHLKSGGAARAAGRWLPILERVGWEVLQVAGDEMPARGSLLTGKPSRGWGRVREIFAGNGGRKRIVENRFGEFLRVTKPDLVWFHNISGGGKWGWSEEMIRIAREHAPVLWTLHDMWALGSGEESYWEVEENKKGSGMGQGSVGKESRVESVCGAGGKYPVRLTAPSQWLAELTYKMTDLKCMHLPNPIDLKIFSPGDQTEARRRLGLPRSGLVVLAGADSLQDPRKGFDLLEAAWQELLPKDVTLALFGRHGEARPEQVYLGNLLTDEQMVAAYRAADLYVHPARMENAPCTIQESLGCGTPVLAGAVGGIPGMVVPEKTGYLVPSFHSGSFQKRLASALADPRKLRDMREQARRWAEEAWRPDTLGRMLEETFGGLKV